MSNSTLYEGLLQWIIIKDFKDTRLKKIAFFMGTCRYQLRSPYQPVHLSLFAQSLFALINLPKPHANDFK